MEHARSCLAATPLRHIRSRAEGTMPHAARAAVISGEVM